MPEGGGDPQQVHAAPYGQPAHFDKLYRLGPKIKIPNSAWDNDERRTEVKLGPRYLHKKLRSSSRRKVQIGDGELRQLVYYHYRTELYPQRMKKKKRKIEENQKKSC